MISWIDSLTAGQNHEAVGSPTGDLSTHNTVVGCNCRIRRREVGVDFTCPTQMVTHSSGRVKVESKCAVPVHG